MSRTPGRNFFFHPGPTNIPDRVLAAMQRPTTDFMGAEFRALQGRCHDRLKGIFRTSQNLVVHVANGHGAWESAMVNTCAPGDHVLVPESGFFSVHWAKMCEALGLVVETVPCDWRQGMDIEKLADQLAADREGRIKAVCAVHNETSTGTMNDVAAVRAALDTAGHDALLMVDTISSLGSIDFRMDDWRVDVAVGGSQKGLMLPVGLSFTGVSEKALAARGNGHLPHQYWSWREYLPTEGRFIFPGTAPTQIFEAMDVALDLIENEGFDQVLARHQRLAGATRAAITAWQTEGGLEFFAERPPRRSDSVTAILMPEGHDAEAFRQACAEECNVSLGGGLGALHGRLFRIGHMGDLNEAMLLGALGVIEMQLARQDVPHNAGGIAAAVDYLTQH